MFAAEEKIIIDDYKKALRAYYRNKEVIDLDAKVTLKPDCWAVRMEKMNLEAGTFVPPQRRSGFSIFFVVSGTGEMKVGDVYVLIKDNTLVIIPSRVIYSSDHSGDAKGYYFTFNINFFVQNQFPKHHLLKMDLLTASLQTYAYINETVAGRITEILENILDEQEHERKKKEEMIAMKLLEFMIICERVVKKKDIIINLPSAPASKFLNLIQQHYKTHHSTSFYARHLHLHPNSLNAIARRYLGQSAKSTIDTTLIEEAKHLLYQTNLSVKEIAYELGFRSVSHFFRFFKRHTGISPANYRKSEFENVSK